MKTNAFTDWQPFMQDIISEHKPKTVFEFGLGLGTELFLKSVEKVYSLELLANPELNGWYEQMIERYKGYDNWKPYLLKCEDKMTGLIKGQCAGHIVRIKPDLVFVDPGVHFRGDLVNLAMSKEIPLIVAHDTRCGFDEDDIYGWLKIEAEGYDRLDSPISGQGTTLWKFIN